ncbi:UNVERIFIED_CONTAM: hypothetical protein K2H54_012650 [Gekko kuhli]
MEVEITRSNRFGEVKMKSILVCTLCIAEKPMVYMLSANMDASVLDYKLEVTMSKFFALVSERLSTRRVRQWGPGRGERGPHRRASAWLAVRIHGWRERELQAALARRRPTVAGGGLGRVGQVGT